MTTEDAASPRERVLTDKDGDEFVVVSNPRGDGDCAANVIVTKLKRLCILPQDFTARMLRRKNAEFTRTHHGVIWVNKLFDAFVSRVKFATLLAYADFMERDGSWWGEFDLVIAGFVLKVDLHVLYHTTGGWRSTFGMKLEVELDQSEALPEEFAKECEVCVTMALVNFTTLECDPETGNHYVEVEKKKPNLFAQGALVLSVLVRKHCTQASHPNRPSATSSSPTAKTRSLFSTFLFVSVLLPVSVTRWPSRFES